MVAIIITTTTTTITIMWLLLILLHLTKVRLHILKNIKNENRHIA